MPRALQFRDTAPFAVKDGALRLGNRLALARKRRRLTLRELAAKAGISYDTARAAEAGNLQTGLGAYLVMLWAMGLESEIDGFADPDRDETGKQLDIVAPAATASPIARRTTMATSERRARDRRAYVYLQMPQSLEIVTAGYYELDFPQGVATGSFVYSPIYLDRKDALPIEPYELPLSPRRATTVHLKGIFGALRDASPDAWGRRIIEKHTGRADLTEVDYLLHSPEDRAGALSFGRGKTPPGPLREFNQIVQLEALLAAAEAFLEQEHAGEQNIPEQLFELLHPGTSMGGARPKNVVEDGDRSMARQVPGPRRPSGATRAWKARCWPWPPNAESTQRRTASRAWPARMSAREAIRPHAHGRGLPAPSHGERPDDARADDTHGDRGKWSYLLLADELRRRSARPADDLQELFRRMAFNALISNTDDHPRNHALIAPTENWELSPAYDLTPNPLVSQEKRDLAMACGRFNRYANRANLLSEHAQFKLSHRTGARARRPGAARRRRAVAARAAATRHIGGRVRSPGAGVQLPGLRARPRERTRRARLKRCGPAPGVAGGPGVDLDRREQRTPL